MNLNKNKLQHFFKLAFERHSIYLKHQKNDPKPWTDDPIFQKYRFCNVFRKLDKVSQYIIKNVIEPNETSENLWKAIIISRFFSRIETIQILLENNCLFENHMKAKKLLTSIEKQGKTLMTNAFILNPLQINGIYYKKHFTPFVIIKYLTDNHGDIDTLLTITPKMKMIFEWLIKAPSTAGFMAYEYITDFTYSRRYFIYKPLDYYTWGNFTIGSLRGLKRLCGLLVDAKTNKNRIPILTKQVLNEWRIHCEAYKCKEYKEYFKENNYIEFYDISMREVEHWLCEYDKYMRMKNGECKRLKRKYNGT